MKKFLSKFLKDTRGVVMMEYVILGCFAVAVTVVAVLALGKAYNNGLVTMGYATVGMTSDAVEVAAAADETFSQDVLKAADYAQGIVDSGAQANAFDYEIYQ